MDHSLSSTGNLSPPPDGSPPSGADVLFKPRLGAAAAGSRTFSHDDGAARLLVVDDDRSVRRLSVRALQQAGYRVDEAVDGEFGWEALQHGAFELLVTDNSMPRLNGVDLIVRLRAAGMTLPAILASGTLPWDETAVPPELQPLSTIEKPFVIGRLLATVGNSLRAAAMTLSPAHLVSAHG